MNEKIVKLMNEQINKELYSAYLYLDFSNFFRRKCLNGYANWYYVQAQEERDHAMSFYNYLHQNDEEVKLLAVAEPKFDSADILGVLKAALKHEKSISESIHNIYAEAHKLNDFRTCSFLDLFIKEQTEEEENALDMLNQYELFGSNPSSLYMLNSALEARTYTAPAAKAE